MEPINKDKPSMSACAWVRQLEDKEAARIGQPVPVARGFLARRLKVAPGTLENMRRGRVKEPRASLVEKIKGALIRELEGEIQALNHELEILRRSGAGPDSEQIFEVETLLAQAKKLLRGA